MTKDGGHIGQEQGWSTEVSVRTLNYGLSHLPFYNILLRRFFRYIGRRFQLNLSLARIRRVDME